MLDEEPMLCSGSVVGTRQDMISFGREMYREGVEWAANPDKCFFNMVGDDQAILNYLHYRRKAFPQAQVFRAATGGIVANIANWGAHPAAPYAPPEHGSASWTSTNSSILNVQGLLVNKDGSVIKVVHQFDHFSSSAPYLSAWLDKHPQFTDSIILEAQQLQNR